MPEGLSYVPEEERAERPETRVEKGDFANLDLAELIYGPPVLTKNRFGDAVEERRAERGMMLNGTPCRMVAVEDHPPGKMDDWFLDEFRIESLSKEKGVMGSISASVDGGKLLASTSIQRYSDEEWLRGAGVGLYEKMLDYLASDYGARHGVERFTHLVQRMPGFSVKKRLSEERWDEIFLPILERRGYRDLGDGNFEREYVTGGVSNDRKVA